MKYAGNKSSAWIPTLSDLGKKKKRTTNNKNNKIKDKKKKINN